MPTREGPQTMRETKEAQAKLPSVVVPFEQPTQRDRPAQTSQPARARMLQALADVQAMLCAVPGRLKRTEGGK